MKFDFFKTLKEVFTEVETDVKNFADAKTADGKILKITPDLKEGSKVEIIAEDATVSLAPAGDYPLEDGNTITVDEAGMITNIKEAEMQEEKEVEMKEDKSQVVEEAKPEGGAEIEARVAQLEEATNMILNYIKGQKDEMSALKNKEVELAKANEEKLKEEVKSKDVELSKIKIELKKYKSAPSINFKAVSTETKNLTKTPLSDMQKRLQGLAG